MAYVFDPESLHEIVRRTVARKADHPELDDTIDYIAGELDQRWPGHILPPKHRRWIFNNAGGAMGQMMVLHASITEYVMVFGTSIGTEGHSGRFMAEDFFFILEGEQWAYREGQLERDVYRPGDLHVLPKGRAEGYRMPDR